MALCTRFKRKFSGKITVSINYDKGCFSYVRISLKRNIYQIYIAFFTFRLIVLNFLGNLGVFLVFLSHFQGPLTVASHL